MGPPIRQSAWALFLASALLVVAGVTGCADGSLAGDDTGLAPLIGQWRGVLLTQGGDLPFHFEVRNTEPPAVVINAGVETPFSSVIRQGAASYALSFEGGGDSRVVARMSPNGEELSGYWQSGQEGTAPGSGRQLQMPFSARKSDKRRFPRNDPELDVATSEGIAALPDVNGTWHFDMEDAAGVGIGAIDIAQVDELVTTSAMGGRPAMEGIYRNGLLRMSVFDGTDAVMIHGRAQPDGSLEGTLWVADQAAVAWTAQLR